MRNEDINRYAFLTDAIQTLIAARHVLSWTFMLGYYMRSGNAKALFEYQQEMLIANTEHLQDIMENTAPAELLLNRKEVLNRASSIDHFRQEMVQRIERGEFEDLLMTTADAEMGDRWACVNCTRENKNTASRCASCQACRTHGEPDCKVTRLPISYSYNHSFPP